jgi:uncharacterized XkdX family phage protein
MDIHEMMFNLIKMYYVGGFYQNSNVAFFVKCNSITPSDYKIITGQDYVA